MNNKDLIAQYVDTGLNLPERQVVQLPNWAKKTYIRKRVIATANNHTLKFYEIKLLGDSSMKKYFETINSYNLKSLLNSVDMHKVFDDRDIDSLINTYINNVNMKGNFHFSAILEYISDENKDKFINLYLNNNMSNMAGNEISDIIMNSDNPMPLIIRMFTNEHVLSIMNYKVIEYLDKRVGVVNFLNELNDKTALKLSELMLDRMRESANAEHVIKLVIKNMFNLNFDSISESAIYWILYLHKDNGVKLLIKNLNENRLASIFREIERWVDIDDLEPMGFELAIKYGGVDDPRPTFEEVYTELIKKNGFYTDFDTRFNIDKFMEYDYLSEPLPKWAPKVGYFYSDSTMGEEPIYGLSGKSLKELIKKQIPKVFELKKNIKQKKHP